MLSRLRPPSPPVRWERLSSPQEPRAHPTQAVSTRCRQWASWEGARSARGEPGEGSTAAATLSCPGQRGSGGRVCFLGCFTNTLAFQKNSPDPHPAAQLQFLPLQMRAQAAESVKKTEARSEVPASAATGMLRAASSPRTPRERQRWKVPREDQLAPDSGKVTHRAAAAPWLRASVEWACGTRLPTCF